MTLSSISMAIPKTDKAYACQHDTGETTLPVSVLHIHPALTPAVRAFIDQEFRNAQAALPFQRAKPKGKSCRYASAQTTGSG